MKQANLFLAIAVIAVVVALANAVIVFQKVDQVKSLVGYATDDIGEAELEVLSSVAINFTVDSIDWGAGQHDEDVDSATLDSEGTVTNGNWTSVDQGLILKNTGNVNASINLEAGKTPEEFIGGDDVTPEYNWKATEEEEGTCSGTLSDTSYSEVSTGGGKEICSEMQFSSGNDELLFDIEVVVPLDTPKEEKSDEITATATAA